MKDHAIVLAMGGLLFTGIPVNAEDAATEPSVSLQTHEEQMKANEKLLKRAQEQFDEGAKQHAASGRLLVEYQQIVDAYRRQIKETDALLEREDQLATHQEVQQKRFDAILTTWETQQQQYQQHLDALKSAN
jgi:hypothetical protein